MAESAPLPPNAKPDPNGHPRDTAVETAVAELLSFMGEWVKRHGLTAMEYIFITSNLTVRQARQLCLHERTVADGPPVGA